MTAPDRRLTGVVMVGGRSVRMGTDKAMIRLGGRPLWTRQVGVLRRSGAHPVMLSLRRRQRSFGKAVPEVRDAFPDSGPVAGLAAALASTRTPFLAVLAVDLPLVNPPWFRRLLAACTKGCGAVAHSPMGYEPLAAIYPRAALDVCLKRIKAGRLSLQGLVAELERRTMMARVPCTAAQRRRLLNWNSPREGPRARRRLPLTNDTPATT